MPTILQVAITVSRTPGHRTEESPHCDYWNGDDVADKENRLGGDGDYSDYNGYDVRDVENDGDDFGMACTHGDMLKIFDHIVDSNQRCDDDDVEGVVVWSGRVAGVESINPL